MARVIDLLNPELKGKYKVVNTDLPVLHSRIGKIDFRTITEEEAEQLIAAGTSYLIKLNKVRQGQ
jgi:hypothetical protein